MSSGLKQNIFYNILLTVSGFVVNFITFPYLSRVLGVQNIGVVNFVDSIVNYGIIFSMLGVGTIGIREVSKNRSIKDDLSKSFLDIFSFNAIFTFLSMFILVVCTFTIPFLFSYREFLYIGVLKIFFNFLLVEWFFKGIEDFRYITVRSLIVKILFSISIFVFIKTKNQSYLYYLLTLVLIVINVLFNWRYLFSKVNFNLHQIQLHKYSKSIVVLGIYAILTSMYTTFNVVYLGFIAGDTEVGLYSTATKLYTIFLAIYTAFTGVMLPRMSSLYQEGNIEAFKTLIKKSLEILFLFSFPLLIFTTVFAPEIIYIIAGNGYVGASLPMRIVMPLLFVIGYEQILILQILMPIKKDKVVLRNSIFGAILSLLLNFLLVPHLLSIGSAIVWVASEILILILSQIVVKKVIQIGFPLKVFFKEVLVGIPLIFLLFLLEKFLPLSPFLLLLFGSVLVVIYYFIIRFYVLKSELVINLFKKIKA